MTDLTITHIGGPTVLIELGGWRLLTDPTFDPPGRRYFFGLGTMSRKLRGPAIAPADLGRVDAVLLSHDHHDDNLDPAGRALLPQAGKVITTAAGARRLGGNASGLMPWQSTTLEHDGRPSIEVTATPCRHGPPLSHPIVGDVVGFALRWEGQEHGLLWISGDTVLYEGLEEVARRIDVGLAIVHLGGVRFPVSGPVRYTMAARDAVKLCALMQPADDRPDPLRGLEALSRGAARPRRPSLRAPADLAQRVRWLEIGAPAAVSV